MVLRTKSKNNKNKQKKKRKKAEKYQLLLDKYKKMTYTKLKSLASKHGFKGKKSELAEKLAKLVLEDE